MTALSLTLRRQSLTKITLNFRKGDVPYLIADPALAEKELGFKAPSDLDTMCRDLWNWQTKNPEGYAGSFLGDTLGQGELVNGVAALQVNGEMKAVEETVNGIVETKPLNGDVLDKGVEVLKVQEEV